VERIKLSETTLRTNAAKDAVATKNNTVKEFEERLA
jgi:hypothetical protein